MTVLVTADLPVSRADVEAVGKDMAERLGPSIGKVMQERGIPMDGPPPPFVVTEAFDVIRGR
jgi:hypothetical protein